jgi:hypothetical protein
VLCVQSSLPFACILSNAADGFACCGLTHQATLTTENQHMGFTVRGFSTTEMQVSPGIFGTAAVISVSLDKVGVYAPSCEKLKSKSTLAGGCPHALHKRSQTSTLF